MPLVGSTITRVVVFVPLIVITGVTGVFFRALAVTMSVSLLTSLVLALTWTPTLSQYFIRGKRDQEAVPPRIADQAANGPLNADHEANARQLIAAEEAHLSGFFL